MINFREADGLDTLKRLQDELAYEKRLLEEEINDGARAIQQLKDTIVEVNALTISEQKYVVKAVKAREETVKLVCAAKESQLSNEESIIAAKIEEEKLAHDKMMSFLSSQQIALSTSVEEWMIKYETDTEAKAQELEQARIKSLEDAEAYKNLKAEYDALEKIAEEHRLIAQQELLEKQLNRQKKRAAIKIQRWYRKIYGKRSAMKSGGSEKIGKNKGKDKKSPKKAKKK